MKSIYYSLFFILIFSFLSGCAPVRDTAGRVSDDLGEVGDELGKERYIGSGSDGEAIVVHPQGDKKIKMTF